MLQINTIVPDLTKVELEHGPQNKSSILEKRSDLISSIENYKDKYKKSVPRPSHWSGWILSPLDIEFWLDGENRIHERLKI